MGQSIGVFGGGGSGPEAHDGEGQVVAAQFLVSEPHHDPLAPLSPAEQGLGHVANVPFQAAEHILLRQTQKGGKGIGSLTVGLLCQLGQPFFQDQFFIGHKAPHKRFSIGYPKYAEMARYPAPCKCAMKVSLTET